LGNICRSPTALGVFRKLVADGGLAESIASDSAGISDYNSGEPPDGRAQRAAARRGVDLGAMRARQVTPDDIADFDLIVAMDRSILRALLALARKHGADGADEKVRLLLDYAPHLGRSEIPDPFLRGVGAFEHALELVEAAARGLLDDIRRNRLT
jgi:protein-tyrosine phosphatase